MKRDIAFADTAIQDMLGLGIDTCAESGLGSIYNNEQITEHAFTFFRAHEFPYHKLPIHVCMQEINRLANTPTDKLLNTNTAYHVADTYHPHRYHAHAGGATSQVDAYNSDKLLRKAIELDLKYEFFIANHIVNLKLVRGTQAVANFRPGAALKFYREYCKPGDTVLDTSTGYGGRLVGFMASGFAGKYIGIDPEQKTHEGNLRMAADLSFRDKIELYNLPAEDVQHDLLRERCDFAFTSPPYFCKEHYSDNPTQSWVRYPTAESWRTSFLLPMMRLQYAALKAGAYSLVNINTVQIGNKSYPLAVWCKEVGETAGFEFIHSVNLPLTRRFGPQKSNVSTEPILVFRKNT